MVVVIHLEDFVEQVPFSVYVSCVNMLVKLALTYISSALQTQSSIKTRISGGTRLPSGGARLSSGGGRVLKRPPGGASGSEFCIRWIGGGCKRQWQHWTAAIYNGI